MVTNYVSAGRTINYCPPTFRSGNRGWHAGENEKGRIGRPGLFVLR
jgi:hypothetical protein